MTAPVRNRCARCGKRLRKGGLSYVLKTELVSYFDGYVYGSALDPAKQIEKIEKQVEGLSESELEEQVYKRIEYRICPECRDSIDEFLKIEE